MMNKRQALKLVKRFNERHFQAVADKTVFGALTGPIPAYVVTVKGIKWFDVPSDQRFDEWYSKR